MPDNLGALVVPGRLQNQVSEGPPLRLAVILLPANHAYPERGVVEAQNMRADLRMVPPFLDLSIPSDDEVVADILPATLLVPFPDLGRAHVHLRRRVRAVDHDEIGFAPSREGLRLGVVRLRRVHERELLLTNGPQPKFVASTAEGPQCATRRAASA